MSRIKEDDSTPKSSFGAIAIEKRRQAIPISELFQIGEKRLVLMAFAPIPSAVKPASCPMYQSDLMQRSRVGKSSQAVGHHRKISAAVRTLRRAIEQCQELVFVTDVGGAIQYANPACEILTGFTSSELLETRIDHLAVELPKGQAWRFLRDRALETGVFRGALGVRCKNGSVAELDLAITVVRDPHTQAASLVCTALAVAVQREISIKPARAQAMHAIDALASGVLHDFNNLLMVIGAYAEMGLPTLPAEHAARRNLQEIQAAVRRASDLTRRLLMIGRRPSRGQQLVSINWIIEDTAAMLSRILEEDIEVRVSLGKHVGMLRADPGQIEQVLLNLAVNARDAMPNGGRLLIETESVQVDEGLARKHRAIKPGEHVLLTVSDSGHGMLPDQLARIFEPYYTTKAPGKGTGLGLAIVHSIVQQSGGCISAESKPGAGTSFKIYLPIEAPLGKKAPASCREEIIVPRGDESLLIVEDAEALRQPMAEFLSSLGYRVNSAVDGEEALRLLEHNARVDLIIADVVMPRMSGPEFARQVSLRWPHTKTLFVSGHAENVALRKGVASVGKNFLQKPFPLKTLAVEVRKVLRESAPARAAAAAAGR
ncbi:MAG TPA: ATP-binding protein [Terriglobales bacterium]|nr:ATP-binding protein [Terriglobales bacterium]